MKIIEQSHEILNLSEDALQQIERAGRTCYQSQDKITEDSAEKFVAMLQKRQHTAMIEFSDITVKFITNRGVTHELVRHRHCSFAQESTRYVSNATNFNYDIKTKDEIIAAYEKGYSMKRISKLSIDKYTEWQVYKALEGIEKRSCGSRGWVNHNFMNKIDSSEKAYFLGLFVADGNLHIKDGKKVVTLTQHQDQFGIKAFIQTFIKSSKPSKDKGCFSYSFVSEKMFDDLVKIGVIPNKTYITNRDHVEILWESIPIELKQDFIRGLLEGGGSLRFYKQNNPGETDSCQITFLGNRYLLRKVSGWIKREFDYETSVKKHGDAMVDRIDISTPKIGRHLCERLYSNFIFPFAHTKAVRALEQININDNIATFGDESFIIIKPEWFDMRDIGSWSWMKAMINSEEEYIKLRQLGWKPQHAREVLPNSLKTEICVKTNIRDWLHIFELRTSKAAHPQMRALMIGLLNELKGRLPTVFGDVNV